VIRLSVNGKAVSGGENCNYRKGYLGLESEGGPSWSVHGERLALRRSSPSKERTLWTAQEFAEAAFMVDCRPAKPTGNSSLAVPAVQLCGADGKGFELPLTGAQPGEYQRFVITLKGRNVSLEVNGKETQRVALPAQALAHGRFGLSVSGGAAECMNLFERNL
jgi:hypothetical protein